MNSRFRGFRFLASWIAASCGCFLAADGDLRAQVVQLPTTRVFGVATTVSVPDRGAAYLGGVRRGVDASVTRGVPGGVVPGLRNRAITSSRGASNVHVRATIIDLNELDRAVLAAAARRRRSVSEEDRRLATQVEFLSRNVARGPVARDRSPEPAAPSNLESIRRANQVALEQRDEEAERLLRQGERAEAEGKPGVARIYYQMAARRMDGERKLQVSARIRAIDETRHVARLADR